MRYSISSLYDSSCVWSYFVQLLQDRKRRRFVNNTKRDSSGTSATGTIFENGRISPRWKRAATYWTPILEVRPYLLVQIRHLDQRHPGWTIDYRPLCLIQTGLSLLRYDFLGNRWRLCCLIHRCSYSQKWAGLGNRSYEWRWCRLLVLCEKWKGESPLSDLS